MGSSLVVSRSELRQAQDDLGQVSAELRARYVRLSGEVAELLTNSWQGDAAQGFAAGWQKWQSGAEAVVDALGRIGVVLGDIERSYGVTDADNAADLTDLNGAR